VQTIRRETQPEGNITTGFHPGTMEVRLLSSNNFSLNEQTKPVRPDSELDNVGYFSHI
jgi:hypothetical protein